MVLMKKKLNQLNNKKNPKTYLETYTTSFWVQSTFILSFTEIKIPKVLLTKLCENLLQELARHQVVRRLDYNILQ